MNMAADAERGHRGEEGLRSHPDGLMRPSRNGQAVTRACHDHLVTESPETRRVCPVIDDIQVGRAEEVGLLRSFSATIGDCERDAPIGHIRGLIAWRSELLHLFEAADELSRSGTPTTGLVPTTRSTRC